MCPYLWCQKLWCATEGASSVTVTHPLLTQPKVCNLDIAFSVQKQVVQLEVPEGEQVGQVKVKFGQAEHEGFNACSVFRRAIVLERVGSRAGVKVCGQYYSWKPVSWRKYNAFGVRMILILDPPVDNFVLMEVLEAKNDTGSVENGSWLCEDVGVDVHHQITPSSILHHKAHMALK